MLSSEVHAALGQMLQALTSSDNNVRSQAEEQLQTDWVANRPEILLMGLVEQLHGAEEPSVSCNFMACFVLFEYAETQFRCTPQLELNLITGNI